MFRKKVQWIVVYSITVQTKHSVPKNTLRAAPKVMPPILLCCPTMSEADVGGTAVETELSHEYPVIFCYCVTDGSRGAIWQIGVWHESVDEARACHWIRPCRKKNCSHWHWNSLNIYRDQIVDSSTVMQWVVHFRNGDSNSGSPPLVQILKSPACRL